MCKNVLKSLLVIGLIFLGLAFFVSEKAAAQQSGEVTVVATVNIYDAKIISQEQNKFKLSFDLSNREGIQPQIRYAVQLVKEEGETQTVIEEKIYEETVSLGAKEMVKKTIDYTAPQYLSGQYQLWLVAKNESGLMLALNKIGEITLAGSNKFLEIAASSCYLKVDGEAGDKKYNLVQGVDIKPEEKLIATCDVTNHFNRAIIATPKFTTYWRTSFGKTVADNNEPQTAISLKAGEKKQTSLTLPKASVPQAYNAVLILTENNQTVSNSVTFHYVIHGASATIQNLRLDKDYYVEGDTAQVSFNWTPSADVFPNSRLGATQTDKIAAELSIKDSEGQICATPAKKELTAQDLFTAVVINLSITADCINPQVTLALKDHNGNTLDQKVFGITSKNAEAKALIQNEKQTTAKAGVNSLFTYLTIFIMGLLILSLIIIAVKKRKGTMVILFLILASALLIVGGEKARADTFSVCGCGDYCYYCPEIGTTYYTVNLNKSAYLPGENVIASGSGVGGECSNAWSTVYLGVTINNTYREIINIVGVTHGPGKGKGSVSIPAESTPGSYNAVFLGCGTLGHWGCTNRVTYSIPYTVIKPNQPPVTPTISGPTSLKINTAGAYTAASTDPDGDQIRYGFDWDINGIIDQWSPTSGYVNSGTAQSVNYQWPTAGSKTFQVLAEDSKGARSGWRTHTINITSCAPNYQCFAPDPECTASTCGDTITGTASCIDVDGCNPPDPTKCASCSPKTKTCPPCPSGWKEVAP